VPFTLLAVAPGRYDLYQRHHDGTAETGFDTCIAQHLTIEHAADLLERLPRSASHA
jgi:precorrin-3B synthase